jgi:hypothetical protein
VTETDDVAQDRLVRAVLRLNSAMEALSRLFDASRDTAPKASAFAEPLWEFHEARVEYAAALKERGWVVPEGLLDY